MGFIVSDAILGLSLTKFLLHLLNFAILFTALWLILYKPVMKFIRARQERIEQQKQQTEENLRASEEARAQEEERLRNLDEEIEVKRAAAEKDIFAKCDEKLRETEQRADEIIRDAERRAAKQADKVVADAKQGIKDAAVALASNIIEEKIDKVDDALIDKALKDWKND
ncbi:MAG TPA: hypothetical protein DCG79_04855 [Clostridiales bacterium]|nr:hypothetical protein [Clostridiales bacterium]